MVSLWAKTNVPGNNLRARSTASRNNGPSQGQFSSTSIPAFCDNKCADRRPPTTAMLNLSSD